MPRAPLNALRPVFLSLRPTPRYTAYTAAAVFPFSLFSTTPKMSEQFKVNKSNAEWQAQLSPEQVGVASCDVPLCSWLRELGTGRAGRGWSLTLAHPPSSMYNY
jgi:hypothetical protein